MPPARRPLDAESVLRSRFGPAAAIVVIVLLTSLATTLVATDFSELEGRDPGWAREATRQLAYWGLWGLLAAPIVAFGRWTWGRLPHWPVFLALHLPLAFGASWLHQTVVTTALEDIAPRGPGGGLGGGPGGGPGRGARRERAVNEQTEGVAGESTREGTGERTGAADDESRGRERGRGRQRRDERRDLNRVGRGVINYWIVLGLGAGLHAYRRRRDEEERAGELELSSAHLQAELAEARLDVLRGQLQPHFLFNALHTVGGLIREEQPDTALRALGALGDVLRTTLRQAEQHEVSLADELEVVRRYLELERLRMGERLETQLPDAGELDAALGSARVPVLVLLPLIENAVRHGLAPLQDGGTLQVLVERRGPSLVLVVQDDGPGFPDEVLRGRSTDGERPSIGLANTRERLITLYGDAGRLELTNPEAGGARAEVHLPLSAGTAPS